MRATLLIIFCLLNMGFIWPFNKPTGACTDRLNASPIGVGYNEHFAHQQKDGTISFFIVDRSYYKCSVRQTNNRKVTKEEWEATLKDYRYEEVK